MSLLEGLERVRSKEHDLDVGAAPVGIFGLTIQRWRLWADADVEECQAIALDATGRVDDRWKLPEPPTVHAALGWDGAR